MEEMSEPEAERDPLFKAILELLVSAGYSCARESSVSAFDKVSGGLAWCIAATNSSVTDLDDVICSDQTKLGQVIEDALKSIRCPYPIQAHQVQLLDYEAVYPVVQWLVCHVLTIQASIGNEAAFLAHEIEEEESNIQKLKNLLIDEEISAKLLHEKLEKQTLERKESDLRSFSKEMPFDLQAEVLDMKKKLFRGNESKSNSVDWDHSLTNLLEELKTAKIE